MTTRRLIGKFKLNELDSQDPEGLVKLAKSLTLEPDSKILKQSDTYLAWERKGRYAGKYSLKKLENHIDYVDFI